MKLYFRRRWYRPFHRGRQWFLRLGKKNCRVIRRGRRWIVHYRRRWISIRRFMIRFQRRYRMVTRRRGRFYITFKRRKVRFGFRRSLFFVFHGKRTIVRPKRLGGRLFYKFRINGRWTMRRMQRRLKRKLLFSLDKTTAVNWATCREAGRERRCVRLSELVSKWGRWPARWSIIVYLLLKHFPFCFAARGRIYRGRRSE